MPTPQAAACGSRAVGTALTRVTPTLSTHVTATAATPAALNSSARAWPASASARRSRPDPSLNATATVSPTDARTPPQPRLRRTRSRILWRTIDGRPSTASMHDLSEGAWTESRRRSSPTCQADVERSRRRTRARRAASDRRRGRTLGTPRPSGSSRATCRLPGRPSARRTDRRYSRNRAAARSRP